MANNDVIKLLMVEDDSFYSQVSKMMLQKAGAQLFDLVHAEHLAQALLELAQKPFDVVLLDLSLPDSDGIDTFTDVYSQAPYTPIVVLTALDDEALAMQAVRLGAQDYLIKGEVDSAGLARALKYAIERHRTLVKLQRLSLVDDLTGLLNRRGFFSVSRQHLKIARRTGRQLALFFIDLDGLKQINDGFGHMEGDSALKATAAILKATFRTSDVIGRIGGDEFTILAVDAGGEQYSLADRVRQNLERYNIEHARYRLSFSMGVASIEPDEETSLEELLELADQDLYAQKQTRPLRS